MNLYMVTTFYLLYARFQDLAPQQSCTLLMGSYDSHLISEP